MSDFKSKKELMDYVKASPDNHVGYDYVSDWWEDWDEHWEDGALRNVKDKGLVIVGRFGRYTKLPKREVDKTKETARELINNEITFSAFRYALPRHNTIVNTTVNYILDNWDEIESNYKDLMCKEITKHFEYFKESSFQCDIDDWQRILDRNKK